MVKAEKSQLEFMETLRLFVIEVMDGFDIWSDEELKSLKMINMGILRKNATQRHGVTRWKKGVKHPECVDDVEVVPTAVVAAAFSFCCLCCCCACCCCYCRC